MHNKVSSNQFNPVLTELGARNELLHLSQILKTKSIESIHKLRSKHNSSNL